MFEAVDALEHPVDSERAEMPLGGLGEACSSRLRQGRHIRPDRRGGQAASEARSAIAGELRVDRPRRCAHAREPGLLDDRPQVVERREPPRAVLVPVGRLVADHLTHRPRKAGEGRQVLDRAPDREPDPPARPQRAPHLERARRVGRGRTGSPAGTR